MFPSTFSVAAFVASWTLAAAQSGLTDERLQEMWMESGTEQQLSERLMSSLGVGNSTAQPTTAPTAAPTPAPPALRRFCSTDRDCRGGDFDPAATCRQSRCQCNTPGFAYADPNVPLCVRSTTNVVRVTFIVLYRGTLESGDGARFTEIVRRSGLGTVVPGTLLGLQLRRGVFAMICALDTTVEMLAAIANGLDVAAALNRAAAALPASRAAAVQALDVPLSADSVTMSVGQTDCEVPSAETTALVDGVCHAVTCSATTLRATTSDGLTVCVPQTAQPQIGAVPQAQAARDSSLSEGEKAGLGVGVASAGLIILGVVVFLAMRAGRKAEPAEGTELNKNEPIDA